MKEGESGNECPRKCVQEHIPFELRRRSALTAIEETSGQHYQHDFLHIPTRLKSAVTTNVHLLFFRDPRGFDPYERAFESVESNEPEPTTPPWSDDVEAEPTQLLWDTEEPIPKRCEDPLSLRHKSCCLIKTMNHWKKTEKNFFQYFLARGCVSPAR